MVRAIPLLLLLLLLLFSGSASAASKQTYIQLELEADSVNLNSSVMLNVVATGLEKELSLDALDNIPFDRRETAGGHLRIVDGKWIEYATRRIELIPQRAGKFTVGPVMSGDVVSNTLELQVLEVPSFDWTLSDNDVQFESSLSTLTPFTQQLLVFEATLEYQHNLTHAEFLFPDFNEFRVIREIKEKQTWHEDGRRTIQWRYLLFPETSGVLEIPPLMARGRISRMIGGTAVFERKTKGYTLDVKAPPIESGWWLPAHKLTFTDEWSESPPELALGKVLKRRLRANAEGVSASQLPRLVMPQPAGLTVRKTDEKRAESIKNGKIESYVYVDYEILPDSVDAVYIDTLQLSWWDTTGNQPQTAIIPPRRLEPASAQREDLLSALDASNSLYDRLARGFNQWMPGYGNLILFVMLTFSLVYLFREVKPVSSQSRQAHREKQQALVNALQHRHLEQATRWINAKATMMRLTPQGQRMKKTLNSALVLGKPVSDSDWQDWLQTAIDKALFETCPVKTRHQHLPGL